MTHLDLFSGIGGFAIAAQAAGFTTIGFSEIEPYACKILKQRWSDVPNFGDIKNITKEVVADANSRFNIQSKNEIQTGRNAADNGSEPIRRNSSVDLITGGFPCQPYSVAGKRAGASDDRALWPQMLRVIAEAKPRWVLGENVAGIISMELDAVLSDLEAIGYSVWPVVIPACAVDARHRRDRVWIIANATSCLHGTEQKCERDMLGRGQDAMAHGQEQFISRQAVAYSESGGQEGFTRGIGDHQRKGKGDSPVRERLQCAAFIGSENMADTNELCLQGQSSSGKQVVESRHEERKSKSGCDGIWKQWPTEPELGRVAHGIPNRSHRLKGLGNAIVPQVAEVILREIVALL